jgi:hypothetical protein
LRYFSESNPPGLQRITDISGRKVYFHVEFKAGSPINEAGMTSGVGLNKAQPDLCLFGDKEHLTGCEAVLSDRRNILPEIKIILFPER